MKYESAARWQKTDKDDNTLVTTLEPCPVKLSIILTGCQVTSEMFEADLFEKSRLGSKTELKENSTLGQGLCGSKVKKTTFCYL